MNVSPLIIETMLQAYYCADFRARPSLPPARLEAIHTLANNNLVALLGPDEADDLVRATEKGKAWVEMILATPLPERRFIDPRTNTVL